MPNFTNCVMMVNKDEVIIVNKRGLHWKLLSQAPDRYQIHQIHTLYTITLQKLIFFHTRYVCKQRIPQITVEIYISTSTGNLI